MNLDTTITYDMGGNYKLDEFRCAIVVAQLQNYKKILERLEKRLDTMFEYEKLCSSFPLSSHPSLAVLPDMHKILPSKLKNKFVCKYYFPLLTSMQHLKHVKRFCSSTDYFAGTLALPIDITKDEQTFIIKEIKNALR